MKKVSLLLLILLTISCSSDDDNAPSALEKNIVNKWILENRVITDDENYIATDCIKLSTLEFFEDDSFKRIEYIESESGDCILDFEQSGEWWTNGFNGLNLDLNGEIDSMTADVGNLLEPLLLESDVNGEYLLISNFTETNQIIEVYKKSN
jgi:hypothetical protein